MYFQPVFLMAVLFIKMSHLNEMVSINTSEVIDGNHQPPHVLPMEM